MAESRKNWLERATRYRKLAEEIRTALEGMQSDNARSTMLFVAESYDALAARMDRMAGVRPPDSNELAG
jgi:hypothetical protein